MPLDTLWLGLLVALHAVKADCYCFPLALMRPDCLEPALTAQPALLALTMHALLPLLACLMEWGCSECSRGPS